MGNLEVFWNHARSPHLSAGFKVLNKLVYEKLVCSMLQLLG